MRACWARQEVHRACPQHPIVAAPVPIASQQIWQTGVSADGEEACCTTILRGRRRFSWCGGPEKLLTRRSLGLGLCSCVVVVILAIYRDAAVAAGLCGFNLERAAFGPLPAPTWERGVCWRPEYGVSAVSVASASEVPPRP